MSDEPEATRAIVQEPTITDNSRLAVGYVLGRVMGGLLRIREIDPATSSAILEHETGNRYRLSIVQISGVE